jgi:hypothetical protein
MTVVGTACELSNWLTRRARGADVRFAFRMSVDFERGGGALRLPGLDARDDGLDETRSPPALFRFSEVRVGAETRR